MAVSEYEARGADSCQTIKNGSGRGCLLILLEPSVRMILPEPSVRSWWLSGSAKPIS